MKTPRILAFSGSLRAESYNQKLAAIAAAGAVDAGADVTVISLRDFPMPLFDEDLEAASGLPETAKKLKELFLSHDGLLIASPEYNSSVTAALKNAIDWISRTSSEGEPSLAAFRGKTAVIFSASPGGFGGLRGLVHLRAILGNIGVNVLPDQIAIPKAYEAFTAENQLADEHHQKGIKGLGAALAKHLHKHLA
ncbi:MAG: NAD(P)H-dependent oxidoreductase [Luteolibacter sp.]